MMRNRMWTWKSTRTTTPMMPTTLTNDEAGRCTVRMLTVRYNGHHHFYRKLPQVRPVLEDDGA